MNTGSGNLEKWTNFCKSIGLLDTQAREVAENMTTFGMSSPKLVFSIFGDNLADEGDFSQLVPTPEVRRLIAEHILKNKDSLPSFEEMEAGDIPLERGPSYGVVDVVNLQPQYIQMNPSVPTSLATDPTQNLEIGRCTPDRFCHLLETFDIPICPPSSLTLTHAQEGEGAFGLVRNVLYHTQTGNVLAVAKHLHSQEGEISSELFEKLVHESKSYSLLRSSSNVIRMLGAYADQNEAYIVFEYANGRSLEQYLETWKDADVSMQELLQCCFDIATGVREIQERDMVHRDIAARNCLVFVNYDQAFSNPSSRPPILRTKIADLGLCRPLENSSKTYTCSNNCMVPLERTAPEVWDTGVFTKESDIFSLGMTFGEILSLKKPLSHLPEPATQFGYVKAIAIGERVELTENIPTRMRTLIEACWDLNPENRPRIDQILSELSGICSGDSFPVPLQNEEEVQHFLFQFDDSTADFDTTIKAKDALCRFGYGPKSHEELAESACKIIETYLRHPIENEERANLMNEMQCIKAVIDTMQHFSRAGSASSRVVKACASTLQAATLSNGDSTQTRVDDFVLQGCVPALVSALQCFVGQGNGYEQTVGDVCAAFSHICSGAIYVKEDRMLAMERGQVIRELVRVVQYYSDSNHPVEEPVRWAASSLLLMARGDTEGCKRRRHAIDQYNGIQYIVRALDQFGPNKTPEVQAITRLSQLILAMLAGSGNAVNRRANLIISLGGHKHLIDAARYYSAPERVNGDVLEEITGALAFLLGGGGEDRENRCRALYEADAISVLYNVLKNAGCGEKCHNATQEWTCRVLIRLGRGNEDREKKIVEVLVSDTEVLQLYQSRAVIESEEPDLSALLSQLAE